MVRSSFVALLALSITANLVLGVEVFNAKPEKESSVKALRSTDLSKESSKTHEEPINNGTKILEKDEKKSETLKEQEEKPSVAVTSTDQNATTVATPIPNTTEKSVTRSVEETTPVNKVKSTESKVGNFTGEQADLNKPKVISHDGEDEEVTKTSTQKNETASSVGTLGTTSPSTEDDPLKNASVTSNASIDPSTVVSISEDVKSTKELNPTKDQTNSAELAEVTEPATTKAPEATTVATNASPTNAATTAATAATISTSTGTTTAIPTTTTVKKVIASTTIAPKKNKVEGENVTTTSTVVEVSEGIKQAELTDKDKESSDGSKDGSMPSGIIALVTAITFAVAIVIGYISMVVWKQYLEHRYGRRQLLVNELEFDTNDLRHFEL